MSPSLLDPVLTSIAREEIPDCYVRIHTHEDGSRGVSLHAGNYNGERAVTASLLRSVDPLRVALEKLIDGYWNARRPGTREHRSEGKGMTYLPGVAGPLEVGGLPPVDGSWCTAQDYEPDEAA